MKIYIDIRWYQWLSGLVAIGLVWFLCQNLYGTFAEGQPQACWSITWLIGIPLLIALYFTFIFRWSLKRFKREK
ncbi:hypothetical protein DA01_07870 [Dehalococcoides mccartyi]|jgi:hypothetical protein|uniref:Uncharacterized protein n=1 Tax=Dehalococcoides mccartyi TaxID=61435 RepID=A0A0V8M557_9CHLR|nr:hypothetical protein DA01_07870 [Dehalococcoides mccartyi]